VRFASGEIRDGLDSSRRSLDIIGEQSAHESFRYAEALHLRGTALLSARRAAEALPDLTRATETLRHALGPEHRVTRTFEADRALALAQLGRHGEARQLIPESLPRDSSPGDPLAARLPYVLGVARRLQGEYDAALPLQQQSLASMHDGTPLALERMNVLKEMD
jgi:tetratricopeptide (TPR) repeat protein